MSSSSEGMGVVLLFSVLHSSLFSLSLPLRLKRCLVLDELLPLTDLWFLPNFESEENDELWSIVDDALGATQAIQGRNLPMATAARGEKTCSETC
jgi:hypothetical protein